MYQVHLIARRQAIPVSKTRYFIIMHANSFKSVVLLTLPQKKVTLPQIKFGITLEFYIYGESITKQHTTNKKPSTIRVVMSMNKIQTSEFHCRIHSMLCCELLSFDNFSAKICPLNSSLLILLFNEILHAKLEALYLTKRKY